MFPASAVLSREISAICTSATYTVVFSTRIVVSTMSIWSSWYSVSVEMGAVVACSAGDSVAVGTVVGASVGAVEASAVAVGSVSGVSTRTITNVSSAA